MAAQRGCGIRWMARAKRPGCSLESPRIRHHNPRRCTTPGPIRWNIAVPWQFPYRENHEFAAKALEVAKEYKLIAQDNEEYTKKQYFRNMKRDNLYTETDKRLK